LLAHRIPEVVGELVEIAQRLGSEGILKPLGVLLGRQLTDCHPIVQDPDRLVSIRIRSPDAEYVLAEGLLAHLSVIGLLGRRLKRPEHRSSWSGDRGNLSLSTPRLVDP
jgi:hypothetical protein